MRAPRSLSLLLPPLVVILLYGRLCFVGFSPDESMAMTHRATAPLGPMDLFILRYWDGSPWDAQYQPLDELSYRLNARCSAEPWLFHAWSIALLAMGAAFAGLILLELTGAASLAAVGGALYAALPIHTEAVGSFVARSHLEGNVFVLAAWWVALQALGKKCNVARVLCTALTFVGLLFCEDAVVVIPIVILSAWLLGKRLDALVVAGMSCAAAGYWIISSLVLAHHSRSTSFVLNPLAHVDAATRVWNGLTLVPLYAARTLLPVGQSADYSYNALPVMNGASWVAWGLAGILFAGIVAAVLLRKRSPLCALALLLFPTAILPNANWLQPAERIFSEPYAITAALAWPIFLAGLVRVELGGRRQRAIFVALAFLVGGYATATCWRLDFWSDPETFDLRLPLDAPQSARAHVRAAGWCLSAQQAESPSGESPEARKAHLDRGRGHVEQALAILQSNPEALLVAGGLAMAEKRYADAIKSLSIAGELLAKEEPPVPEPKVFRFRGESYLNLGRPDKALEDFKLYKSLLSYLGGAPDPAFYRCRGFALAQTGKLEDALADFTHLVESLGDRPESWNNRGYCRFQLKDYAGAVADYREGLALCRRLGLNAGPGGDTAQKFLLRLADVHSAWAKVKKESGDIAGAAASTLEVEQLREEARGLSSQP